MLAAAALRGKSFFQAGQSTEDLGGRRRKGDDVDRLTQSIAPTQSASRVKKKAQPPRWRN